MSYTTYKYVNDTEAALKRIKAECRINKVKPAFDARMGMWDYCEIEGTVKQVETILNELEKDATRMKGYDWVISHDFTVEVTVHPNWRVRVRISRKTESNHADEEE
tara:strand:- start:140 stop:457 length:318 start_codon:yes stop_codon:yes gene_type:complete